MKVAAGEFLMQNSVRALLVQGNEAGRGTGVVVREPEHSSVTGAELR
jgi:hypothetical protein